MDKKKRSVSEKRDRMLGFVTAMPAMILLFVFTVYPVFYLIYYSMFSGSLISAKKTFVGLDNYKELFGSETFRMVLVNTVVYTVLFVSLTMVLAVIIAVWLNGSKHKKLNNMVGGLYLYPSCYFHGFRIHRILMADGPGYRIFKHGHHKAGICKIPISFQPIHFHVFTGSGNGMEKRWLLCTADHGSPSDGSF